MYLSTVYAWITLNLLDSCIWKQGAACHWPIFPYCNKQCKITRTTTFCIANPAGSCCQTEK